MGLKVKKHIDALIRDLDAYEKKRVKAWQTAVKVEGYRITRTLKEEIKAGAPGGRQFARLSQIAKGRRYGAGKKKPALFRLAIPIRYRADYRNGHMLFSIGYVDPFKGPPLSKMWKALAELHQGGARIPATPELKKSLIAIGARLKKRKTTKNQANVFFLKESTSSINIPARPIIDPFWQAHRAQAERNIATNFDRKMNGERI